MAFYHQRWTVLCGITLLLALPSRAFGQSISEYQVKAAYIYNFAKGTEWPEPVLPSGSALAVCVFGGDEDFVLVLRSAFSGKFVNGHPLQARHVNSAGDLKLCHVAFFRASAPGTGTILRQLSHGTVLLVGEEPGFLSKDGMINFVTRGGKISFEVSPEPEHSRLHYGVSPRATAPPPIEKPESRPLKSRVEPVYPDVARNMHLKGTVLLRVTVRADGVVKEVKIIGGHPLLAAVAQQAVFKWRYQAESKETVETASITFGQ